MKVVKILVAIIFLAALGFGGLMFWKAKSSRSMTPELGIVDGQLKQCGPKPNCVSSFSAINSAFYIEPLRSENAEIQWDNLNMLLGELNLEIISSTETYIHARATTALMKFVDDVEFLLKPEDNVIHMRSASRVGYSDMGANKKRLEKIREALDKK